MRPIYESAADRDNERSVIDAIAERWKCDAWKLPLAYRMDYALARGTSIKAFAEVKCRSNERGAYDDYMLSLAKLAHARRLAEISLLPVYLVVRWSDGVGFCDLSAIIYRVEAGGRTDRNDPQDMEPVAMISVDQFKQFNA